MKHLFLIFALLISGCGLEAQVKETSSMPENLLCGWEFKHQEVLTELPDPGVCYTITPDDGIAVMPIGSDACDAETFSSVYRPGDTILVFGRVRFTDSQSQKNWFVLDYVDCPI